MSRRVGDLGVQPTVGPPNRVHGLQGAGRHLPQGRVRRRAHDSVHFSCRHGRSLEAPPRPERPPPRHSGPPRHHPFRRVTAGRFYAFLTGYHRLGGPEPTRGPRRESSGPPPQLNTQVGLGRGLPGAEQPNLIGPSRPYAAARRAALVQLRRRIRSNRGQLVGAEPFGWRGRIRICAHRQTTGCSAN